MKLFIITGQTATGKTNYAIRLARQYKGELINCDSRQIYKGLDIITGKDIPISTKIWLYDIVDPKQYFSSYDYVSCALPVIKDIISRGKTPIIVGGTYFYLFHLLYEVTTQHIKPDWKLRNNLNNKPVLKLQKMYKDLDLQSFHLLNNSDKNNPQRLIRKIEILKTSSSMPLNSFGIPKEIALSKKLGIDIQIEYRGFYYKNTADLLTNIKDRVEKRIKNRAIGEVKQLLKEGYSENDPGLKTIGYTQIIEYLKGKITKKQAVENWISKELQYAKRQYTFMKKDPHIVWREII